MNRGYLVQCVPLVAHDRDSGQTGVAAPVTAPVGMDFTGEADRAPAPLHYLMNEQAKSLAALQELQNEVGALLEFRDLVIDTFPHLRVKMASHTNSPGSSHIPVPLCTSGRREWEPGVRVRRKLPSKETAHDTSLTSAGRSRSNSQGSKAQTSQLLSGSGAGGSGASSAGSSAVQDSGFGTESKEHYSASSSASAGGAPASQATSGARPANYSSEDELWNLLDVIHRKGSRLRQEVEQLQTRLQDKEVDRSRGRDRRHPTTQRARSLGSATQSSSQAPRDRPLSAELEHVDNGDDSIDVDAELVASRARASHLRASHLRAEVATARRDLQELLQHEHQGTGVGGRRAAVQLVSPAGSSQLLRPTACFTPVNPSRGSQKPVQVLSEMCVGSGSGPVGATVRRTSFRDSVFDAVRSESCGSESDSGKRRLGRLDGVLTRPADIPLFVRSGAKPHPTQVAAILRETDRIELRRHLLTSMAENSALRQQTEREQRVRQGLASQLDSAREENDELRFQLEERSIELEGTRARVRLLERMQSVLSSPASANSATSAGASVDPNPITPAEEQTVMGHSSSTESAHDAAPSPVLTAVPTPAPAPTPTEQPTTKAPVSPRRRPSKIPLGTKSYYAPKPPSAKLQPTPTPYTSIASHTGSAAGSTLKRRSASTPDSGAPSWRARRDSSGRASAASTHHGSRESLSATSGARSRSTPAKSSDASLASASASSVNRRDLSKSRDSVHSSPGGRKFHAAQTRRGSAGANAAGTLKDDPTKGRTKLNFWTGWWKIGILDSPS